MVAHSKYGNSRVMLLVVVSHQCCAVGVMCVSKHSARGGSVKHHRICIHTTLALRGLALSSPVSSWIAVGALMAHLLCFEGILEEWMKLKQPRPFCSFSQGTVRRINQKHTPKTNWNANVHALGITQRSSGAVTEAAQRVQSLGCLFPQ